MKTNYAIYLRVKCFFHLTHFQNGPKRYSFENLLTRREPYLFERVTINTFVAVSNIINFSFLFKRSNNFIQQHCANNKIAGANIKHAICDPRRVYSKFSYKATRILYCAYFFLLCAV